MRIIEKDELKLVKDEVKSCIRAGKVFIHPTDTIYGIGCDATNSGAVKKIRKIKERKNVPFSVIAPSKEWIEQNMEIPKAAREWLDKLPGPYTLVLPVKNKNCVADTTNSGMDTLGVRIPDHWASSLVADLGVPIITTSANKVGQDHMKDLESLDPDVKGKLDFIIYEGEKTGKPSTIVNLSSPLEPLIVR